MIDTTTPLYCIERDDYINKPVFLFAVIEIMIGTMFTNSFAIRSYTHIPNVIDILLFFWIKVYLNLPIFSIVPRFKRYRFCFSPKNG